MLPNRFFAAILVSTIYAGAGQSPGSERDERWKEDFQVLRNTIAPHGPSVDLKDIKRPITLASHGQKDFVKLYPNFEVDMESLLADLPKLNDTEITLRLMKFMASANVNHNLIQPPASMGFYLRLPLQFGWYPDGLAIVSAPSDLPQALGTHVLKIADQTPEAVLAALAPYVAHENDTSLKENAMGLLRLQAMLKYLGLLNAQNQVVLTLRKPGGQPFQLIVQPGNPKVPLVGVIEALHVKPSLARTRPNDYYWQRYLEDSQTLYVQYNKCANDPILPFHRFATDVLAEADGHQVERLVIDLRYNPGGDSRILNALRPGLEQRLSKLGRLYVLIGSGTASAAVENAAELKSFLHATLIGEPTGGTPSSYGDEKLVTLPNSKLVVQYTTKWLGVKTKDEPDGIKPDVTVLRTFDDIVAGRDAVLEAAIAAK
jgi:hypothetical protein